MKNFEALTLTAAPREPLKFSNFSDSAAFAEGCGAMCYRVIVHTANWLFAISVPKSRYGSPNFANFAIFEFFVKFNGLPESPC